MNLKGIRPITQLGQSNPIYSDGRPCFAPDGKTVLFERSIINKMNAQLFSVPIDNTIKNGESCYYYSDSYQCLRADWSWSSSQPNAIAFTAIANGTSTVMLLKPGGTPDSAKAITTPGFKDAILSYPAWFANGKSLLLTNYSKYELLKYELSTNDIWTLTPELFMSGMGTVSPTNSNLVAFAGQPRKLTYDQNINQIWIQDGFNDPELFSSDEKGAIGRAPWFSPDGTVMAFEAKGDNGMMQIFLKRITIPYQSTDAVQVSTAKMYAQHAKFSPDGKTLVWAQQTSENCSQIFCGTIEY
ncbi:MAG: hypothetical protein ABJM06_09660 [Gilvibacter sp.]